MLFFISRGIYFSSCLANTWDAIKTLFFNLPLTITPRPSAKRSGNTPVYLTITSLAPSVTGDYAFETDTNELKIITAGTGAVADNWTVVANKQLLLRQPKTPPPDLGTAITPGCCALLPSEEEPEESEEEEEEEGVDDDEEEVNEEEVESRNRPGS